MSDIPFCTTCGYAVEYLRSCYTSAWRLDPTSDRLTIGRYVFCDPFAKFYPAEHNLWSRNWTTREAYKGHDLGEDLATRHVYSKGGWTGSKPPAVVVGSPECIRDGEKLPAGVSITDLVQGASARCWTKAGLPVPRHDVVYACASDCSGSRSGFGFGLRSTVCTSECADSVYTPYFSLSSLFCTSECAGSVYTPYFSLSSLFCTSECADSVYTPYFSLSSLFCTSECAEAEFDTPFFLTSAICTTECVDTAIGFGFVLSSVACASECATSVPPFPFEINSTICTTECADMTNGLGCGLASDICFTECADSGWNPL